MDQISLKLVELDNSPDYNLILAQSHFIKTVEDVHELMVTAVPGAKFGLAFNEASGPRLVRHSGTDEVLTKEAVRIAKLVGSGHLLVLVMRDMYPINILTRLKDIPELAAIYCATANQVQVLVVKSKQGRGVLGVIDGESPVGVEGEKEIKERKEFLRKIDYKQ
jgi:hypothetical protein